jgi:hypothetical protein
MQQSKEKAIYFSFSSATQRPIRTEHVKAAAYKQVTILSKKEMTIVCRPVGSEGGQPPRQPCAFWTRLDALVEI